jgi:Family of unknown function (DUF6455)
MCEMMEHLGLDPAEGAVAPFSLSYITAFHRCEACPATKACREWLERMPAAVSLAPRFCPNADVFFEMQFDHPGRSPWAAGDASCTQAKPAMPDKLED